MVKVAVAVSDHVLKQGIDEADYRQREAERFCEGYGRVSVFQLPLGRTAGLEIAFDHAKTMLLQDSGIGEATG
jgi:hypothetical protein